MSQCKWHSRGTCKYGDSCRFSHAKTVKPSSKSKNNAETLRPSSTGPQGPLPAGQTFELDITILSNRSNSCVLLGWFRLFCGYSVSWNSSFSVLICLTTIILFSRIPSFLARRFSAWQVSYLVAVLLFQWGWSALRPLADVSTEVSGPKVCFWMILGCCETEWIDLSYDFKIYQDIAIN